MRCGFKKQARLSARSSQWGEISELDTGLRSERQAQISLLHSREDEADKLSAAQSSGSKPNRGTITARIGAAHPHPTLWVDHDPMCVSGEFVTLLPAVHLV
jgi:hypothetical protein